MGHSTQFTQKKHKTQSTQQNHSMLVKLENLEMPWPHFTLTERTWLILQRTLNMPKWLVMLIWPILPPMLTTPDIFSQQRLPQPLNPPLNQNQQMKIENKYKES